MQLTDEQKQKVSAWIADGVKLSDIQTRLGDECDVRMTYMDVRLLVDDLKLTPKDAPAEPPKPAEAAEAAPSPIAAPDAPPPPSTGKVTLAADTIARPGTMASGSVTFSDGKRAVWYLDQMGRLGVTPEEQGYRPAEADVQEFQMQLDRELQKLGY